MKKIILIDSSYPINNRNIKILNSLTGIKKAVIAWNRDERMCQPLHDCDEYIFKSRAQYGHQWLKFFKLTFYMCFIRKIIKRLKPDIIIASHWEILFLVSLVKPKGCNLIYENLDMPTADNKLFLMIQRKIEKCSLERTDVIIFASRFFVSEYEHFKKKIYILENKPLLDILSDKPAKYHHITGKMKISFIGNLRYFEIMCNLISATEKLPIDILFFGDGPDYLKLKSFVKDRDNVYFFGKYDYEDIKCIYDLSDIIWAVYPNKDYNVKYAISNKFFESLLFKKPAFFANNTFLGKLVEIKKIGLVVDPYNIENINATIREILLNRNQLYEITENIERYNSENDQFWDKEIEKIKEIFN
jgi:glycosyltransferase involved in cell wall biosynthesis